MYTATTVQSLESLFTKGLTAIYYEKNKIMKNLRFLPLEVN